MSSTTVEQEPLRIRIIVAEDEDPPRGSLADLIAGGAGFELVGVASETAAAIELIRALQPDVALIDLRLRGGGGARAVREIRAASPATRSITLAAAGDRSGVLEVLRAGAVSVVVKGVAPAEVIDAIRRAMRAQSSLSAKLVAELVGDGSLRTDAKHFEALLESAPDAVVIVELGGRIFFVNEQTEKLFGYHRTELLDQPIDVLLPERFHERHVGLRDVYLTDPRPRPLGAGLEVVGRRKDGIEFPVDISLSRIETSDGRFVTAFVRDATERKIRADLERSIAVRRAVHTRLVSAGEDERRRIAADIHDDSIQVVTAAGIRLLILRRSLADPAHIQLVDDVSETITLAISRLRHLLFELRPPALDHEGLGPALRMYLDVAEEETSTSYHLDDHLTSQPSAASRVILYRIAQEVLTNVRKHACAGRVTVTLAERDDGYYVRVADDGIGFDTEAAARPGHLGLATIQERAALAGGWLDVESAPDCGTTVEFWIAPEPKDDTSDHDIPVPVGAGR